VGESDSTKRLFKIADRQMGYFTTRQAEEAGFPRNNHPYHVRCGHWQRVERGIYRLSNYPVSEYEQMMVWYLWSRGRPHGHGEEPLGVFSHDTALSIYELSDVNPSRIHMTVPVSFRRSVAPAKVLVLHKAGHRRRLLPRHVSDFHGMKITTPLRTLLDVAEARDLSLEIIRQAIIDAEKRGLVSKRDIERHPKLRRIRDYA
jgi:predicted transcriptional regulator of viral defense system